jgi:hypothetical protein
LVILVLLVAAGYDEATRRYEGLAIPAENTPPQISDTTLLVRPDLAKAQRETERDDHTPSRPPGPDHDKDQTEGGTGTDGRTPQPHPPSPTPVAKNTRFYGTFRVDPERYAKDINRLNQEVVQHIAAQEGVDLEITVDIRAIKKDGFPDTMVRIVSENANTLKFEQSGFEDR